MSMSNTVDKWYGNKPAPSSNEKHRTLWKSMKIRKGPFLLSGLVGRKELVLVSWNGKVKGVHVHFSRHNSPNSRTLADHSGRTERLWSISRAILARTSSEYWRTDWSAGPNKWKVIVSHHTSAVCFVVSGWLSSGAGGGSGSFIGDRITLPMFFLSCILCIALSIWIEHCSMKYFNKIWRFKSFTWSFQRA